MWWPAAAGALALTRQHMDHVVARAWPSAWIHALRHGFCVRARFRSDPAALGDGVRWALYREVDRGSEVLAFHTFQGFVVVIQIWSARCW